MNRFELINAHILQIVIHSSLLIHAHRNHASWFQTQSQYFCLPTGRCNMLMTLFKR